MYYNKRDVKNPWLPPLCKGQYSEYYQEHYADLPVGLNGSKAFLCDLNTPLNDDQIISKLETLRTSHPKLLNAFLGGYDYVPLHHAASRGRVKLVAWIIKYHRESLNIRNRNGFTPLGYAQRTQGRKDVPRKVRDACKQIEQLLLSHGANQY